MRPCPLSCRPPVLHPQIGCLKMACDTWYNWAKRTMGMNPKVRRKTLHCAPVDITLDQSLGSNSTFRHESIDWIITQASHSLVVQVPHLQNRANKKIYPQTAVRTKQDFEALNIYIRHESNCVCHMYSCLPCYFCFTARDKTGLFLN